MIRIRHRLLPHCVLSCQLLGGIAPLLAETGAPPLEPVLERLQQAFRRGDAKRLRAACAPKSRLRLVLPDTGIPAGYFNPDQLYFLFDRLFSRRRTEAFRIETGGGKPGRADVRTAAWTYRDGDRDPETRILEFHFHLVENRWYLAEIRSVS